MFGNFLLCHNFFNKFIKVYIIRKGISHQEDNHDVDFSLKFTNIEKIKNKTKQTNKNETRKETKTRKNKKLENSKNYFYIDFLI